VFGWLARERCDRDLRIWYDKNSGRRNAD